MLGQNERNEGLKYFTNLISIAHKIKDVLICLVLCLFVSFCGWGVGIAFDFWLLCLPLTSLFQAPR